MKTYNSTQVDNYLSEQRNKGYELKQIDEGVLGCGTWVITKPRTYSVVKEIYVNAWSSTHVIINYSRLPKKYLKHLEE
jgi:hypothetical protein